MYSAITSTEPRKYQFQLRDEDVFTKFTIDLRIKNGVAVDPQSCHVPDAHVFRDAIGNVYSAYLTETDVENRKNSYYKIQILEEDAGMSNNAIKHPTITMHSGHSYWLFQTYGGVGAAGYMYNETFMSLTEAVKEFKRIFQKLTDHSWEDRNNFAQIRGKMNMLEIDYTPNVVNDVGESLLLEESVRRVVRLMIDSQNSTLPEIQTRDSRKWPIGKLKEKHIDQAVEVLGELLDLVAGRETEEIDEKTVIRCSNRYYSLVPRRSESSCLKLLDSVEAIQDEYDFLDSLPKKLGVFSAIDAHYANLSTKLNSLDADDAFYQILKTCVQNTSDLAKWNVNVVDIFQLNRHGEDQRYSSFKHLGNKKLLWHGTTLANFVRILSQGLKIKGVARGGNFGYGIYFSDMVAKSLHYCRVQNTRPTTQGVFGCMLMCEVALGNISCSTSYSYKYKGSDPKSGYDSVMGCGRLVPNPEADMELEDGVILALGNGVSSTNGGTLQYNEYIVYNEGQVKMKYMVLLEFEHKSSRIGVVS